MLISPLRHDLCLGFVNTLSWRGCARPSEALSDFAGLLSWLEKSAGMEAADGSRLADLARKQPRKAAQVFTEAIALRESLHRILSAVALSKREPRRDVAALQQALAGAPVRRHLVQAGAGYGWQTEDLRLSAAHLLAPVLWSAGDLLVAGAQPHLRQCANTACLWLFLDNSKNASRRWCDMASCGNRAKARRHYLKVTQGAT